MTTYNITTAVRVYDKKQLFNTAMLHATKNDGMTFGGAEDMLKPFGNIDVKDCLQVLLDPGSLPGCDVIQSDVETCLGFD